MKDYPRWYLALAFLTLWPVLITPILLFGRLQPFGYLSSSVLRILVYVGIQSMWIVPVIAFFKALTYYREDHRTLGVSITLGTMAFTIGMAFWLL